MWPRDIALFLQSARADAAIARLRPSLGQAGALEAVYAGNADPWASASPRYRYQRRKYEVLASLLPAGQRFAAALDIGCGLGLLSRHLAARADQVLGIDIAPSAIARAAAACADLPNCRFECHDLQALPASMEARFDLITVADVLYYVSPLETPLLKTLVDRIARLLAPGGLCLVANHYFFRADGESRRSRRIHDAFAWSPRLQPVADHRHAFFISSLLRAPEAMPC